MGNRLGDLTEIIILPRMTEKFKEYGFNFEQTTTHYPIRIGKRTLTEVDIALEDGDDVMVVEVKTHPTKEDVIKHIERLQIIQKYPKRIFKGARLYGAIGCAMIDDDVRDFAFNSGFYVICQSGNNADILKPPSYFKPQF